MRESRIPLDSKTQEVFNKIKDPYWPFAKQIMIAHPLPPSGGYGPYPITYQPLALWN